MHNPVPHLQTALTGPLLELETHLLAHQVTIETWLRKAWQVTPAPIKCSVDLRNAGFKLAPIDTNLFPAGFNNINPEMMPLCIQAAQATFENSFPGCENILIIPENHTRNLFYFESLASLEEIFTKAGFNVRIGTLLEEITQEKSFSLPSGREIVLHPLKRNNDRLSVNGFSPCLIILNNDLSEGIPEILQNVKQPINPSPNLGWSNRLKSNHFRHYDKIASEFANLIGIDPWLINPLFRNCGEVDFKQREGEDCLAQQVDLLLKDIQKKYNEYGISEKPYVIVKADAGTYGMAVMSINSSEQIHQLNRKQREKMSASKSKRPVSKVLIQEGVPSFETCGEQQSVAEPVVYMLGHHVVGGFYRVHKELTPQDNLNTPGMQLEPLAFAGSCNNPNQNKDPNDSHNRFYAYGVIARLALLAAAHELRESR